MRHTLLLVGLALLPGCSTLINGSSQSVSVATAPAGAACAVDRAGERLGLVGMTPGNLTISKSTNDLVVTCDKEGYQQARLVQPPKFVATTFGNLLAGGVVGIVIDAASGANYTYPTEMHIELAPSAPVAAAAPATPVPIAVDTAPVTVPGPSAARFVGS